MPVIPPNLADILKDGTVVPVHGPWSRIIINSSPWQKATDALAACECDLLGLWAEADTIHMALLGHDEKPQIVVVSTPCADRRYPSVGRSHPPAIRLERAARDLFGVMPVGLTDTRPWLDHGLWGIGTPLAQPPADASATGYAFLPVEGDDLHEIPVGPVHAGIIEPGHFRFTADGETVVRLEQRLGYTHKGTEALMHGSDIAHAARLAGRVSGNSTVAYAFAFARAVEAAANVPAPARAIFLRAVMAELERLANHFGDFGAICNDASFVIMHANAAILRERVLRAANACFGHRLMMDCIVPGGIARDIAPDGIAHLRALLGEIELRFPPLVELYDKTTSLQDRTVTTGIVRPELIRQFAPGGYVGRAGGRTFDARRALAYPPYDQLNFEVPVLTASDVNARVWIRIREIEQSIALLSQLLDHLPGGPIQADADFSAAAAGREGMALVEGFRGDVLVWLRIDAAGQIARCHLRDPSWFQWPLLEAAIEGNIVADFPLCNKSFNCSYSGHDL